MYSFFCAELNTLKVIETNTDTVSSLITMAALAYLIEENGKDTMIKKKEKQDLAVHLTQLHFLYL